jgi:hypothetical protein
MPFDEIGPFLNCMNYFKLFYLNCINLFIACCSFTRLLRNIVEFPRKKINYWDRQNGGNGWAEVSSKRGNMRHAPRSANPACLPDVVWGIQLEMLL